MLKLRRHFVIVEGPLRKGKPASTKSVASDERKGLEMDESMNAGLRQARRSRRQVQRHLRWAVMAVVCVAVQAQQPHDTGQLTAHPITGEPRRFVVTKALSPDGTVNFDANDADVRIVRNLDQTHIRLEVGVEDARLDPAQAEQRWLKRMDVAGSNASIELHLPTGRSSGSVTLYVPPVTALVVTLHAGRLTVNGVKGDKNLTVGTGMLTLREADPSAYQHVTAEVGVGQLTDSVFHGKESGLLGRKLIVEGKGPYQLLLHVGKGDIELTAEDGGL
jgi:hypothetical protein